MLINKDIVRAHARCFTRPQLAAAFATWPSDTVTWVWFLGEHITGMQRVEGAKRVTLAIAATRRSRKPLPRRLSLDSWSRRAPLALWREFTGALGAYLDQDGGASTPEYTRLAELASTVVPDVVAPLDEIIPAPTVPPPVEEPPAEPPVEEPPTEPPVEEPPTEPPVEEEEPSP